MINNVDYQEIKCVYALNREGCSVKKDKMNNVDFDKVTEVNWSESMLDFYEYESIFKEYKKPRIYTTERASSVKNYYINGQLIYAVNTERYQCNMYG